jgi:4-amino-4-deoxy-L-arabinose transferase-like glycosyltransferase
MSYEAGAAVLLVGLPWYLWMWSEQMKPSQNDKLDWLWYLHWGLRVMTIVVVLLFFGVAQRMSIDGGASAQTQSLFTTLWTISLPLLIGVIGIFIVLSLVRLVTGFAESMQQKRYEKSSRHQGRSNFL